MGFIKVNLNHAPYNGEEISFVAPCNSNNSNEIVIYNTSTESTAGSYTLKDAHGQSISNLANLFSEGAIVKAILGTNGATIINGDTNSYIEDTFSYIAERVSYGIGSLGNTIGMRGWNQLVNPAWFPDSTTINGVTFTVDKINGTITVSGTATADAALTLFTNSVGNVFSGITLLRGCPAGGSLSTYLMGITSEGGPQYPFDTGNGKITQSYTAGFNFKIYVKNGVTLQNAVFKPQVFCLTRIFGAGNEPSTVTDFKAMFPADYYPYCSGEDLYNIKADKVSNATNGHFAALDSNGNLTDSGKSTSDFADISHTHSASNVTAGTLGGRVQANATASSTLGNAQVRDITISTTDLTAGTSALATGSIYIVYE